MKNFRLLVSSLMMVAFLSVSAFAQAQTSARIALVDTEAFYDLQSGVTKIINAYKSLEIEFKPSQTELENGAKRLQTLQTELQALQNQANDPNNKVPIDMKVAQAKQDEAEKLQRDLKFKQEDAKLRYGKREGAILGPIIEDIGKSLTDYSKQKGYTLVLDFGKLYEQRLVLYWDPTPDITKEFIQFYNARPAGSATTKP